MAMPPLFLLLGRWKEFFVKERVKLQIIQIHVDNAIYRYRKKKHTPPSTFWLVISFHTEKYAYDELKIKDIITVLLFEKKKM